VIGAAHRRRGLVCQDFSLVRQLRSPAGVSLQLLAVADGHGAARYRYSDAGSRLACEQAAEAVRAALQATPLHNLKAWRRMLAEDLPQVIQSRWLAAIERNWQQRPAGEREPFCSSLYGSTLGLLLLAPGWWGCTGLGDWDLVQVSSTGSQLVSEEAPLPGAGEATASLCLPEARARWAERAQLRTIPAASAPFALLISTDGVRKSCATDADFLELCNQIMGIRDSPQLPQGLAEISAGGSGDDLSIAVGRWCPGLPPPENAAHEPRADAACAGPRRRCLVGEVGRLALVLNRSDPSRAGQPIARRSAGGGAAVPGPWTDWRNPQPAQPAVQPAARWGRRSSAAAGERRSGPPGGLDRLEPAGARAPARGRQCAADHALCPASQAISRAGQLHGPRSGPGSAMARPWPSQRTPDDRPWSKRQALEANSSACSRLAGKAIAEAIHGPDSARPSLSPLGVQRSEQW
jgi:hypothetical protein